MDHVCFEKKIPYPGGTFAKSSKVNNNHYSAFREKVGATQSESVFSSNEISVEDIGTRKG